MAGRPFWPNWDLPHTLPQMANLGLIYFRRWLCRRVVALSNFWLSLKRPSPHLRQENRADISREGLTIVVEYSLQFVVSFVLFVPVVSVQWSDLYRTPPPPQFSFLGFNSRGEIWQFERWGSSKPVLFSPWQFELSIKTGAICTK